MLAEDSEIINQFMAYPITVTGRYGEADLTDEDLDRGEFDQAFVDVVDDVLAQNPVRPSTSLREILGFDPL